MLGRDQITRLHDLNADGEADFYENFNNDCKVTANSHAYATCLETDPAGNFYYVKCGDGTPPHGGTMLRVSKDGSKLDVFATGLHAPTAPASPATSSPLPTTRERGCPRRGSTRRLARQFLGHLPTAKTTPPPTDPGKPLCWMPQNVDNSSGGQAWVTGGRWGPFDGHMLTSYGSATLMLVMSETVNGVERGGVVRFPLGFDTGIMRVAASARRTGSFTSAA